MPKNTGKGGKTRKRGKNENEVSKREIILKAPGEAYASVIGPQGQYQMALRLEDMTNAKGIIRGALRKKTWIVSGDLIRVQLREGYEEGTVDIVGKYTADEARELVKMKEVSPALIAGRDSQSDTTRAGATAIRFVNTTGADAAGAVAAQAAQAEKDKEGNRKKNIDGHAHLAALLQGSNKGIGMGDGDDDEDNDAQPQWRGNKRRHGDDDDEEDEEYEEGEEDEEGEEGEEEEEDEEAEDAGDGHAAYTYADEGRDSAQNDYEKYHKKDADFKQRNKRHGQEKGKGAGVSTVQASDVADI